VSKIIKHPDFNTQNYAPENNIALWKLAESVDTNVYSPSCLPTQSFDVTGSRTLLGWRMSDVVGALSNTLTELNMVSESISGCPSSQICSILANCKGDFGSPLTTAGTVIGIASKDTACSKQYSTFTKVSEYKSWIESKISSNGGCQLCEDQ